MVEIIAKGQNPNQTKTRLDVQQQPVEFNYAIQELRDISNVRAPHSFSFTCPMTDKNNKFFGSFYDVNFDSASFSTHVKTDVEVLDSGVLILIGSLELIKVDITKQEYHVTILSEVATLFSTIKDMYFEDLFVNEQGLIDTDLDHFLKASVIVNSWDTSNDITIGQVGAGVIVYPLTDNGLGHGEEEGKGFAFNNNGGVGLPGSGLVGMGHGNSELPATNFKPSINVSWLVNRIAQRAGFTINSDFLTNEIDHLYYFLGYDSERAVTRPAYGSKVGITGNFAFPAISPAHYQVFFTNESAPYNDVDGLFDGGEFTAPGNGTYVFNMRLLVQSSGSDTYTITPFRYLSGGGTTGDDYHEYFETLTLPQGTLQEAIYENISVNMLQGQQLSIYVESTAVDGSGNSNLTLFEASSAGGGFPAGQFRTYMELVSYIDDTSLVDVSANFGKVKVGEFLTELFNRFNLVIYSVPDTPTVLYVEPYNTILDTTNVTKDWSDKVDIDTIVIEPTTKFQKKNILFSDSEGEDWSNTWYQKYYGYVFNKYTYDNPNDFAQGEQQIGGLCQPLQLATIPRNYYNGSPTVIPNVLVPRTYEWTTLDDNVKTPSSTKPMIAFYHGLKDIQPDPSGVSPAYTFSFNIGLGDSPQNVTQYPFFSQFSTSPVTETTIALGWGYNYPSHVGHPLINAGTTAGATAMYSFRKWWARRMHEEYSSESRLMICKAYLTPYDVNDLVWSDSIFINDSYFRVVKIDNFATGGENACNLTLLKVLNASTWNIEGGCSSYPATFNTDGTVNFVSLETGLPVDATEECCDKAGYTWSETLNVCFWSPPIGGGGSNPNNPGGNPDLWELRSFGGSNTPRGLLNTVMDSTTAISLRGAQSMGSVQQFTMTARTVGQGNVSAATQTGQTFIGLQNNMVSMITVDVISVDTGGTSATVGDVYTLRNQSVQAVHNGICRNVGQSTINSEFDSNDGRNVLIQVKQDATGQMSIIELFCTGMRNKNSNWILNVTIMQIATTNDADILYEDAVWNLTPEVVIAYNSAQFDNLEWNL